MIYIGLAFLAAFGVLAVMGLRTWFRFRQLKKMIQKFNDSQKS
jgi:hypothetical protein